MMCFKCTKVRSTLAPYYTSNIVDISSQLYFGSFFDKQMSLWKASWFYKLASGSWTSLLTFICHNPLGRQILVLVCNKLLVSKHKETNLIHIHCVERYGLSLEKSHEP